MVRILEFRRPEASDPPVGMDGVPGKRAEGHSAEIIIFPGVRIERRPLHDGEGGEPKRRAKRARGPSGGAR